MSYLELLETELRLFHLEAPAPEKLLLSRYCDELDRWNRKINLTGLRGAEMVRRLVADPAWIAEQLEMGGVLVDIGSGNGSPALPLHILRNFRQAHLIEARTKRAAFLRHVVTMLKLDSVTIHRERFEHIAAGLGRADWVTLQGVGLTPELIASMRLISSPTTTVVWISGDAEPPVKPHRTLRVPFTNTQVFLFRLDLS